MAYHPLGGLGGRHKPPAVYAMKNQETQNATPNITGNPLMRGFLAALFTAGLSTMILATFSVVEGSRLPYVFIIVLVMGVFGSQMQERMRRRSQ